MERSRGQAGDVMNGEANVVGCGVGVEGRYDLSRIGSAREFGVGGGRMYFSIHGESLTELF